MFVNPQVVFCIWSRDAWTIDVSLSPNLNYYQRQWNENQCILHLPLPCRRAANRHKSSIINLRNQISTVHPFFTRLQKKSKSRVYLGHCNILWNFFNRNLNVARTQRPFGSFLQVPMPLPHSQTTISHDCALDYFLGNFHISYNIYHDG